jgi:hypothetical protein
LYKSSAERALRRDVLAWDAGELTEIEPWCTIGTPEWPCREGFVTAEDQWNRFIEDVPAHEPAVLSRVHFEEWEQRYLDSDPASRSRSPAGVKIPLGPFSEIIKAWRGHLAYDPASVRSPIAIVRGEWDGLIRDDDAQWLFNAFTQSPVKRDVKIGRGTHLMHLETMRLALWNESISFLNGNDAAPVPAKGE